VLSHWEDFRRMYRRAREEEEKGEGDVLAGIRNSVSNLPTIEVPASRRRSD